MKKRNVAILLCVLFTTGLIAGAAAAGTFREITAQVRPDFTVKVDGEEKVFKSADGDVVYPIIHDGTTYLPLRAIGELMGKKVYWYEDEKLIELKEVITTVTDADVIIGGSDIPKDVVVKEEKEHKEVESKNFIGEEKARKIALKKAELKEDEVIFERTELDKDGGIWHYEVEFKKGKTEYDADIKADDGTILKWEVDIDD